MNFQIDDHVRVINLGGDHNRLLGVIIGIDDPRGSLPYKVSFLNAPGGSWYEAEHLVLRCHQQLRLYRYGTEPVCQTCPHQLSCLAELSEK